MSKLLVSIFIFLSFSFSTFSQKWEVETWCDKNKKTNNFVVGDTLYTNCNFVIKSDSLSFDDYYSPLLDSLVVSLKKSPTIVVILNNWQPISKEVYDKMPKQNRIHDDAAMAKFTYVQANRIEYYLVKHGVRNCIISNGKGYKFFKGKSLTKAQEKCEFATQVILAKSGKFHCFELESGKPVILQNIYFEVDKWDILPDSQIELDIFADYLLKNPNIKIEISGHTDNTGDNKKNIELSQKRADAVATYLKMKFVTNSIETKGYGSSKPFRTNSTDAGRAQNRRIEVRIIK